VATLCERNTGTEKEFKTNMIKKQKKDMLYGLEKLQKF
jgi:hypothetical protein